MRYALIALLLTGCATTKEVKVPYPVYCKVEPPVEPDYPKASQDAGIFERVKVALAEIELRRGYEAELKVLINKCRGAQ